MTPDTSVSDKERVWKRLPFALPEQLKVLLIFVDGLPFRTTQQGYPNRLDVGEAADLSGWSRTHLHLLIHRAMELDLIAHDSDRFYMSERVSDWEFGNTADSISESGIPGYWTLKEGPTEPEFRDDSLVIDSVKMACKLLKRHGTERDIEPLVDQLLSESMIVELLEQSDSESRAGVNEIVMMAYHLGFIDVSFRDNEIRKVKVNERGERLITQSSNASDRSVSEADQDLPVILQPDGQMMIPLDAPLREFRKVHPFVLFTGMDNMVEYSIDQRSLVKAENEGWDTSSFYGFLRNKTGTVPETVQSLFQDTEQEAEEVRIEDAHHLLTFETGATAAEAMRVLSNYKPERIGENRVLLRSSSSAETIKKNLSRSGIRIQMSTGPKREESPLKNLTD